MLALADEVRVSHSLHVSYRSKCEFIASDALCVRISLNAIILSGISVGSDALIAAPLESM